MIDSSPAKQNYNAVDLIMLMCAILVVAIHIAPFGTDSTGVLAGLNWVFQSYLARIAVPFFFIASGYFNHYYSDI